MSQQDTLFRVRAVLFYKFPQREFLSKFNGDKKASINANIRILNPTDDAPTQNCLHVAFTGPDVETIAKAEIGSAIALGLSFRIATSAAGFVNQYVNGSDVEILTGNHGV